MRIFVFFVLMACVVPAVAGFPACEDSQAVPLASRTGLLFQSGVLPAASAPGNVLLVWLGTGYGFGDRVSLEILFYTGHMHMGPAPRRPVDGTLLLGGSSLELRSILLTSGPAELFAGVGGGLFTALRTGVGYNGSGLHLACGLNFRPLSAVEISPVVQCGWWWWHNGVGDAIEPFDPFGQFWIGGGLSVTFRPRI